MAWLFGKDSNLGNDMTNKLQEIANKAKKQMQNIVEYHNNEINLLKEKLKEDLNKIPIDGPVNNG